MGHSKRRSMKPSRNVQPDALPSSQHTLHRSAEKALGEQLRIVRPGIMGEGDAAAVTPRGRGKGDTFFARVASFFRLIKFEFLIGLLALLLSLGQYFQSVISIRINITDIWREGYTAETRDKVSKFRHLYKKWTADYKAACGQGQCGEGPDQSVVRLIRAKPLFDEALMIEDKTVKGRNKRVLDPRIRELVRDEIDLLKTDEKRKASGRECIEVNPCITKDDYTRAALKYRNAIIECLNTAEAVKAVIRSRPLPFRQHLLYSDTLERRYNDIIEELKTDLGGFIRLYRDSFSGRDTPAWIVLTSEESNKDDYYVVQIYTLVFFLALAVVYGLKRLFR